MTRLFVDMDGTLADFYSPENAVQRYRKESNFFTNLAPFANLVQAITVLDQLGYEIILLSAVDDDIRDISIAAKEAWLEETFRSSGYDPIALFPATDKSKAEYVSKYTHLLDEDCWLLDDYTANLMDWKNAGGRAIKALNGINGKGGKWIGPRLDIRASAPDIIRQILTLCS